MTKLLKHNREEYQLEDLMNELLPQVFQLVVGVVTTAPEAIGNLLVKLVSASIPTTTPGCQDVRPAKTGSRAGFTSTPTATIASGDKRLSGLNAQK